MTTLPASPSRTVARREITFELAPSHGLAERSNTLAFVLKNSNIEESLLFSVSSCARVCARPDLFCLDCLISLYIIRARKDSRLSSRPSPGEPLVPTTLPIALLRLAAHLLRDLAMAVHEV
jgi:hypothetical protein